MYLVLALLDEGIEPRNIRVSTPYTAQLGVYRAAIHALAAYCRKTNHLKPIADQVPEVQLFTINSIQRSEVDILIFNTTVTGKLKFVEDTARVLLALTRARDGLFIIRDNIATLGHYTSQDTGPGSRSSKQFSKTAYAKTLK